ncbi:hypothetical protein O181_069542 [Austropuccinia psidii MF-1]|uniref:Uncharacterized protein n=1 Tax=Austropuccinia psidii MF-1 TaxID=1389203 RepID=A0A9Q3I7E0_9BASI|nr:hypothetical protein [Austropuccinia psidii MF-1]
MEGKKPCNTHTSANRSPSSQQQKLQNEKAATSSKQGQRQGTSHKTLQPGLQNPKDSAGRHGKCVSDGQNNDGITEKGGGQITISEMISDIFYSIPELYEAINDIKTDVSDRNLSICNNLKTNSLSLSQINETLMCFEKVLRKVKASNNENYFGNEINEQSSITKELTEKYSKFNIDDIIETRIKQTIITIREENESVLENISKSFTEVKTYTSALKKGFDSSQEEISKLTMKLNQIISDNTRQTDLWQQLTQAEENHKTNLINSIQSSQHESRNSQRFNNSKINYIEQLLHTLPRMSTPFNQNEGTRIANTQGLEVENSQLKNEFSTSFHNLEPSMGQALLKEVPKLKGWPNFSDEGEYDHMKFIRGIDMIKKDFEFPERLKTQIINKWANDTWRFKVETAFESAKFNADKDKALPLFCQQKDRLLAVYPDMSEFMIHRKILIQCGGGGDLEHAFKSRTTEKSSAEDIIHILEEVKIRTSIGSSGVNLKTRFNTPWKYSVDKNSKENSTNVNHKFSDISESAIFAKAPPT